MVFTRNFNVIRRAARLLAQGAEGGPRYTGRIRNQMDRPLINPYRGRLPGTSASERIVSEGMAYQSYCSVRRRLGRATSINESN